MSPALLSNGSVNIVDIRDNDTTFSAAAAIQDGLDPPSGKPRSFPTVLLYDAVGLRLFEEITYLDEYYLTNTEIEVLEKHARTIAERLPDQSQLVELGSGCVFFLCRISGRAKCRAVDGTSSFPCLRSLTYHLGTFVRSRFY